MRLRLLLVAALAWCGVLVGTAHAGQTSILIQGNLVKAIGSKLAADATATIIDGGGRTLTPGFIDAHTHIALIAPFDQLAEDAGCQQANGLVMSYRSV